MDRSILVINSHGQLIYHEKARETGKSIDLGRLNVQGFIIVQIITEQHVSMFKVEYN